MGMPQYMISSVMLEEHRFNVERAMPNPDWPAAVPVRRTVRFAGLRQRASEMLVVLADRVHPVDRSRPDHRGTWASEGMR